MGNAREPGRAAWRQRARPATTCDDKVVGHAGRDGWRAALPPAPCKVNPQSHGRRASMLIRSALRHIRKHINFPGTISYLKYRNGGVKIPSFELKGLILQNWLQNSRTYAGASALLAALLAGCGGTDTGSAQANTASQGSVLADVTVVTSSTAAENSAVAEPSPAIALEADGPGAASPQLRAAVVVIQPTASTCALPNFQQLVLNAINQARANGRYCGSTFYGSTAGVVWNSRLGSAAAGHSEDMARQNYFSHTSQDGRTFIQRITATGYAWQAAGENIAAGQTSIDQVMNGWLASPGHCVNMMNPSYKEVGVACALNNAATYRRYWTMDLAKPR